MTPPDILANVGIGTWLLWGGPAVFFFGLYVGAYVWMRRPSFGEGKVDREDRPPPPRTGLPDRNGHPPSPPK